MDNKRMVHNLERVREQLKDKKYYTGDINFGYLLDDVIPKIKELIELKEKFNGGFFLTKEAYERNLKVNLNLNEECEYCKSIDKSTKKSPRRKYIYCPMCGRKRV